MPEKGVGIACISLLLPWVGQALGLVPKQGKCTAGTLFSKHTLPGNETVLAGRQVAGKTVLGTYIQECSVQTPDGKTSIMCKRVCLLAWKETPRVLTGT